MNMIETLRQAAMLLFLAGCAFEDLKHGKIRIALIAAGALAAMACRIISGRLSASELITCLIPGLVLMLISAASSQAIGLGDSFMAAVTGLFAGWGECIILLFTAFGSAVLFSAALIFMKKKKWKDQIIFAPFILAGYVFLEVMNI